MNKRETVLALAVALLVGALLTAAIPLPSPARAAAAPLGSAGNDSTPAATAGRLRTSGNAVIRVQPDRASIRFGVLTFAGTPRHAQSENEAIVKKVLAAIRGQGVDARDIATDHFSVRPEYDYPMRGNRSLVGYWSENGIEVTLRDVDLLSPVLIAALDAGATSVDNLSFSTTRMRELRDEARALAVKAALEKAADLATAAGVDTGAVTDIEENSWSYYSGYWNRSGQWVNQAQNVVQEMAPSSLGQELEDGEFSLGQIIVQASVQVSVAIQ